MSGRGRGINNAPAWMGRQMRNEPSPERDSFGRVRHGGFPPQSRDQRDYGSAPPPPPPRGGGGGGDYNNNRGGPPPSHFHRGGGGGGGPPPRGGGGGPPDRDGGSRGRRGPPRGNRSGIVFHSYEQERAWVDDRRQARLSRKSLWDVPPTPEQLERDAIAASLSNFAATDFSGAVLDSGLPQQTRHARRLYIGNLPSNLTEDDLHQFFRQAIQQALPTPMQEDPILSVYINHERRFCFLEFKSVEMTTACLQLDGIDVLGRGKVHVKRPNDYNATMAPAVHPSAIPPLDVSRLGIISTSVQDGPNKIFVGGLHYHLTDEQVLELLQAFGPVKAFHLVKNEGDTMTSKGYGFVEYSDPEMTQVAVMGLNGMDLGGGKVLTARVAAAKDNPPPPALPVVNRGMATTANFIGGYDVEALLDAAMGLRPMPTAPTLDPMGGMMQTNPMEMSTMMPMTMNMMPNHMPTNTNIALPPPPPPPMRSALEIANAALEAAFPTQSKMPLSLSTDHEVPTAGPTRILVLLNMVMDQDLATAEDHQALVDEVRQECAKFGNLLSMKIPRDSDGGFHEPSAVRKIFLEYATVQDAQSAEHELAGRQFGPNVVEASYFSEHDYLIGRLR